MFKKSIKFFATTVLLFFVTIPAQAQDLMPRRNGASITEQIERAAFRPSQLKVDIVPDVLSYAFQFRGVPYRYGAASPRGFDCSGFTSYVFKKFGIKLDRRANYQIYNGRKVERNELRPGDLVFFAGRGGGKAIGHVGIVTKVDVSGGFNFIHASVNRGITESHISETYYTPRYRGACRVID